MTDFFGEGGGWPYNFKEALVKWILETLSFFVWEGVNFFDAELDFSALLRIKKENNDVQTE